MGFRQWATKKLSRVVQEAVVEPVKQDVAAAKDNASEKVGLVTSVIRFLIWTGIGIAVLKDTSGNEAASSNTPKLAEPTHIVINNYIHEGGPQRGYKKSYKSQKS